MSWKIKENRFLEFFAETEKTWRDKYPNKRIRDIDFKEAEDETRERVFVYEDELEDCDNTDLNLYYVGFRYDEEAYNDRLVDLEDDQRFIDLKNDLLDEEGDIREELPLIYRSYTEYCKERDELKSYIFEQNEKFIRCKSYFDDDFLEIARYRFDLSEFFDEDEIQNITGVYFENKKEDGFLLVIVVGGEIEHYFDYRENDEKENDSLFFKMSEDIDY